jgi:hypothetical protein
LAKTGFIFTPLGGATFSLGTPICCGTPASSGVCSLE